MSVSAYTWKKIEGATGPTGATGATGATGSPGSPGSPGAAGDTALFAYAVLTSTSLPSAPYIGLNAVPTAGAAVAVAATSSPPFYLQPKTSLAPNEWQFQVAGTRTSGGYYTWQTQAYISTFKVGKLEAISTSTGNLTIGTDGSIRGGQSSYGTGNGFFLGYEAGNYKFSLRNAGGYYLNFDHTGFSTNMPANLADAQVTTLKIGPNQVTVPVGAYTAGQVSRSNGSGAVLAQSINVTPSGGVALITFSCTGGGPQRESYAFSLYRGGSLLVTIGAGGNEEQRLVPGATAFTFVDNSPGTSATTYSVYLNGNGDYSACSFRSLTYIEAKR